MHVNSHVMTCIKCARLTQLIILSNFIDFSSFSRLLLAYLNSSLSPLYLFVCLFLSLYQAKRLQQQQRVRFN